MRLLSLCVAVTLFFSSCTQPPIPFCPHVECVPPAERVSAGHSPFPVVTSPENVAAENTIGEVFAHRRDFYRAITAFERAEILLRGSHIATILELQYKVLLSYYLAGKYREGFDFFEKSVLASAVGPHFPAWRDLRIIAYDMSVRTEHTLLAAQLLESLRKTDSSVADKLAVYTAVRTGQLGRATTLPGAPAYLKKTYRCYCMEAKSVNKARLYNALLPGLGYGYVGQTNTAITAFLVNVVFIGATYQFAKHGLVFPAIISGSLEVGWYVGGIWGAGRAAAEFNERTYENYGSKVLNQERLYPIFMLDYVF